MQENYSVGNMRVVSHYVIFFKNGEVGRDKNCICCSRHVAGHFKLCGMCGALRHFFALRAFFKKGIKLVENGTIHTPM